MLRRCRDILEMGLSKDVFSYGRNTQDLLIKRRCSTDLQGLTRGTGKCCAVAGTEMRLSKEVFSYGRNTQS